MSLPRSSSFIPSGGVPGFPLIEAFSTSFISSWWASFTFAALRVQMIHHPVVCIRTCILLLFFHLIYPHVVPDPLTNFMFSLLFTLFNQNGIRFRCNRGRRQSISRSPRLCIEHRRPRYACFNNPDVVRGALALHD